MFRLHLGLLLLETTDAMKSKGKPFAALTGLQLADVRRYASIIEQIEAAASVDEPATKLTGARVAMIAPEQVQQIILDSYTNNRRRKTTMTRKKAMNLFCQLFNTKRVKRGQDENGKQECFYQFSRLNLDTVVGEFVPKFNDEKRNQNFYKNLYKTVAGIEFVPDTTTQINSFNSGVLVSREKPTTCPVFGVEINEFGYPASWG